MMRFSKGGKAVTCHCTSSPDSTRVAVISMRLMAFKHRPAVGYAVVRFGCPSYNPLNASSDSDKPLRTCNSLNVSTLSAIVNNRVRPTICSSSRTNNG